MKAMSQIEDGEAVRLINRYFELQSNGRPLYTGSRFETFAGGGDVVEPNRITPADLIAVSMLAVHVPGQAALGITETLEKTIEAKLSQIPVEAKLEEITQSEYEQYLGSKESPAHELWELLRQRSDKWNVGPTTTSKILARKRPYLIPVYDSIVRKQSGLPHSGPQWERWFHAFSAMEENGLAEKLRSIREESGQVHLSLLRVLDIVLWMKGSGYAKVVETVGDEEESV